MSVVLIKNDDDDDDDDDDVNTLQQARPPASLQWRSTRIQRRRSFF